MRILGTAEGAKVLEDLDNLAQYAMIHNLGDDPGSDFMRALAVQLEIWFQWLGTDDPAQEDRLAAQITAIHADLCCYGEETDEI